MFTLLQIKYTNIHIILQEEIEEALQKFCDMFPSTISGECKSFVDLYGKAIIDLLKEELSPDLVCTDLNLCSNKKENKTPPKTLSKYTQSWLST